MGQKRQPEPGETCLICGSEAWTQHKDQRWYCKECRRREMRAYRAIKAKTTIKRQEMRRKEISEVEKHHALELKQARMELLKAQVHYERTINCAVEDGVSNNKIAGYLGLSETAVRKWRSRRNREPEAGKTA